MFFIKKKISDSSDEDLIHRYTETGDTAYFGELYNRYIPLLYGLCLKYLQDTAKAEDAVMQLFENLVPKISKYEINVFRTWIYSVAKNHCLQILRKEEHEIPIDFNTSFMESGEILHLFDEATDTDSYMILNGCIEQLPDPQRISILKFFMEEMSYTDIVEETGYQMKSVKSYIQNGKRNLRICMEKNDIV